MDFIYTMEEIEFMDLVVLHRIDADSTVEKFGSKINTSFFETANLLGTMKVKGLIDFQQTLGHTPIVITEKGRYVLELADQKSREEFSDLDRSVLETIALGAVTPEDVKQIMHIRSDDLAYHLDKLYKKGYIDYTVRSAKITLMLTEKGFNKVGKLRRKVKVKEVLPEKTEGEELMSLMRSGKGAVGRKPAGMKTSEETGEGRRELSIEEIKRLGRKSKYSYYIRRYSKHIILIVVLILLIALGLLWFFKR